MNDLAKQYLVVVLEAPDFPRPEDRSKEQGKKITPHLRLYNLDTEVPNASFDSELSIVTVLSVYAGGSGVDPPSATAELRLATEEGAGMAKALMVE